MKKLNFIIVLIVAFAAMSFTADTSKLNVSEDCTEWSDMDENGVSCRCCYNEFDNCVWECVELSPQPDGSNATDECAEEVINMEYKVAFYDVDAGVMRVGDRAERITQEDGSIITMNLVTNKVALGKELMTCKCPECPMEFTTEATAVTNCPGCGEPCEIYIPDPEVGGTDCFLIME